VVVEGTCPDADLVSFTIDGEDAVRDGAGAFQKAVFLTSGDWGTYIDVAAEDEHRNATLQSVTRDTTKPSIANTPPDDGDTVRTEKGGAFSRSTQDRLLESSSTRGRENRPRSTPDGAQAVPGSTRENRKTSVEQALCTVLPGATLRAYHIVEEWKGEDWMNGWMTGWVDGWMSASPTITHPSAHPPSPPGRSDVCKNVRNTEPH